MSYTYPETKTRSADVFAAEGGIPVSCKLSGGTLYPALAAEKIGTSPTDIITARYAVGCRKFIAVNKEGVYQSSLGDSFVCISDNPGESPVIFEDMYDGTPYGAVYGDTFCLFYDGTTFTSKPHYGKKLASVVMHCGRAFGLDFSNPYLVRWSGEGGITDWIGGLSGAGWAYLRPECGKILNLLHYGDKIAIIREYGVSELTAYGTPENFKLTLGENFWTNVCADSAAQVGGKLLFFSASGLCSYSGNVSRVKHSLCGDVSSPNCCAAMDDAYILGVQSHSLGGGAVLVYDVSDGTDYLIDVAPEAVCVGPYALILGGGSSYRLKKAEEFIFKSGDIGFGNPFGKVLKAVTVDSAEPCDIEVSNGDVTRCFSGVKGCVRTDLSGCKFTVKLKATAKVRSLNAYAEVKDAV